MASALLKTIKANPLDLPVFGSVLTLILSISPYCPKWSRSSSEKTENIVKFRMSTEITSCEKNECQSGNVFTCFQ
jgi:hypothetical protein